MAKESYRAVVQKIVSEGEHGPYAIAREPKLGSITFSLKRPVWQEKEWPEPGMVVMLGQVRMKRAGWRAQRGRFLRPSDEQTANSKQQGERSK